MRRFGLLALTALVAGCSGIGLAAPSAGPVDEETPAPIVTATPLPSRPTPTTLTRTPVPATPTSSTSSPAKTVSKAVPLPKTGNGTKAADMTAALPLINRQHVLPASYRPSNPTGPFGLTPQTNAALTKLIAAARADGVPMQVRSGYRSFATQKSIYQSALRTYSSPAAARRYNAPPGASEHQAGLAVDMWDGKRRGTAFRGTATDKWLSKNAYKFGFIIRYPAGKEAITGYVHEPWHLRYVGVEVAAKFGPANTLTLEEYLGVGSP